MKKYNVLVLLYVFTLTGCSDNKMLSISELPCQQEKHKSVDGGAVAYSIPASDPLKLSGSGGIGPDGGVLPGKKYKVTGGSLISKVGAKQYTAKFGDWAWSYSDQAKVKKLGWGYCLVSGELAVYSKQMQKPPIQGFVGNSFSCRLLNKKIIVIKLDPKKGHRFCFLKKNRSNVFTQGFSGTSVIHNGHVLVRRKDGWYSSK